MRRFAGAPGLLLGDEVQIGDGVTFGAHVLVHTGTVIGEECSIEDHAVVGKRPRLSRHSAALGEVGALQLRARSSVGTRRSRVRGSEHRRGGDHR
jgi:acyl-[acyl carrier protein]--UDP-N-acetylglucosamine O-acyltransferase